MDSKTTIQCNKLMQLENSMLMYGIYNAEMLENSLTTAHNIHNTTSSHERLFAGQQRSDAEITLCKFVRFTSFFHKFTPISKNSAGQIHCTIQGINNPTAHICMSNKNFIKRISNNFTGNSNPDYDLW